EAIGELDFLSDAERQQQLQDWNPAARTDSPQRPTSTQSVHTLFARQALHQPDAIAVVDGAHQISYRELDRRANRLAHYLIAQGVVADNCVGLCVERSADMIVGLLGILKAGAAYVPLDPAYPASRLQHMIATSACKLILSEQHLLEELSFL
ncbi:AMP-binding protein, partial [Undibacterium sp. TJN19]|uniref:AMP-binding protein n=1 Tax=Undibacterium sp. TJN19 TaxID=3413055 RepID=UPI003BF345C3